MLLSDLHCMDRRLSAILRSNTEDIEMDISDDEESEESKQTRHTDTMKEIEELMEEPFNKFKLIKRGKISETNALMYELYIEQKNESYTITVGWTEPTRNTVISFYYDITDGDGYHEHESYFDIEETIDGMTDHLTEIIEDTLATVPEENEENTMTDIEDMTGALSITPHRHRQ